MVFKIKSIYISFCLIFSIEYLLSTNLMIFSRLSGMGKTPLSLAESKIEAHQELIDVAFA